VTETLGYVDFAGQSYPIELLANRLEVRVGEETAVLEGVRDDRTLSLVHTEVPRALRGKGLAEAMVRAALDYGRSRSLSVKPYCPFVAGYIERHPEYQDLVDPGFKPRR
jgi:predicted GNAT family acetyltransferase